MKLFITKLFVLCFFLSIGTINHALAAKFYVIQHKIKKGDNLALILKKYVLKESIINKSTPMIGVTFQKNPHISDWHNLPIGKRIKLYISEEFIDVSRYKLYKKKMAKLRKKQEKKILATNSEQPAPKKSFGMSIFYMASFGTFSQTSTDSTQTNLSQNSPITIGSLISFRPKKKNYFYSGSLYYSKLTEFKSNVTSEETSIPAEIGVNAYFNYTGIRMLQSLFGGIDYEKFSPFNLGTIQVDINGQNTGDIGFDEVYMLYLTAGAGKVFKIFNQAIFMKLSISKSILTSQSSAPNGTQLTKNYSGFKSIFYMNYRITKRFFVHSFYKLHLMSGQNDLTISRYGFGLGVNVF